MPDGAPAGPSPTARCEGSFTLEKIQDPTATFVSAVTLTGRGAWLAGGDESGSRGVAWSPDGRFNAADLSPLDNATGIWAKSDDEVWLTMGNKFLSVPPTFSRGYLFRYTPGTGWMQQTATGVSFSALNGVDGFVENNQDTVFAVGDGGIAMRRQVGQWQKMSVDTTEDLLGVSVLTPTDVWIVGAERTVLHFDGATWSKVELPIPAAVTLRAVHATSASDVWIVGDGGARAHFDGQAWNTTHDPADKPLRAVWALGPGYAVAGGDAGGLEVWNGKTWANIQTPLAGTTESIRAIRGTPDCKITVGATGPHVMKMDGQRLM